MKKRLYISNDEAGFFDNNKMLCLDNPPTQGDFIVGDIVISNKQQNGIFGWVCVLAGSPGRWEVICDLKIIQDAIANLEQRQQNIVNGDINTIKNQITQMAAQALTIDKEHKDELKKLNDKVSVNTNNILNINNELTNIKHTIGEIDEIMGDSFAGFSAQIQINADKIEANCNKIAGLETKHEETNVRIDNVTNEINEIKKANDQQTTDIQGAYDKIIKIEQDIVKNEENAGGIFENISNQVSINTENITNLQLTFTEIDADIVDINKRIDAAEKVAEDAVIKVGSIESAMEDNNIEIENIKKGLVGALVSHGVNANIGMTWKELFELVLGNASSQPGGGVNPMPGELILYKNGAINNNTEFKNMMIDSNYLSDEYIDLEIDQDGAMLWFGFNGKVDFSKYESVIIEIKNVAEHASSIGISRNSSVEYGYEHNISNFNKSFMKGKDEVVIEEGSRVIHTLSFADLYTEQDKEGYLGIYVTRVAGTGGAVNDAILINSITVIPKPLVPCTGLSLNMTEVELIAEGNPYTLIPTIMPADCTDEVVWRSTNAAVATVDQNGVVTPKAVGSCSIRVTCGEITVGCVVNVREREIPCTRIIPMDKTFAIGEEFTLADICGVVPTNTTDRLTWGFGEELEGNDVVSWRSTTGKFHALSTGVIEIILSCGDQTAIATITVGVPCQSIQAINKTYNVGDTFSVEDICKVLPADCTERVYWGIQEELEGNDVISWRSATGKFHALSPGIATITLSCGYKSTLATITVKGDEEQDDGIVLFKNGTVYEDTEFAKICYPEDRYSITNSDMVIPLGKIGEGGSHSWFSFDGYIDFNNYDRVEITFKTQLSTQQPWLCIGRTIESGQYGYMAAVDWTHEELTGKYIMNTTTETTHVFNISDMTGDNMSNDRNGYLLIAMNGGNSTETGNVYISKIVVYPKGGVSKPCTGLSFTKSEGFRITGSETLNLNNYLVVQPDGCTDDVIWTTDSNAVAVTDGIVTVLAGGSAKVQARCGGYAATVSVEAVVGGNTGNGIVLLSDGEYFNDTEFGALCATPGIRDLVDNNGALVYEMNTVYTTAFFSFGDINGNYVNFNNYDAVELTVYTENNNQVPYIQVCRAGGTGGSPSGQYGYGQTTYPVNIMESTGFHVETKKVPTVYTVNMAELRKNDADMGNLLFIIERGNSGSTADGKVYISKIVVYREGEYYPEQDSGTTEPEVVHCTGISVSPTSKTINVGDFIAFGSEVRVSVSPSNCTDSISYRSGNENILSASIAAAGVFQGYSAGTTTMIATCGGKSASCTVTVK